MYYVYINLTINFRIPFRQIDKLHKTKMRKEEKKKTKTGIKYHKTEVLYIYLLKGGVFCLFFSFF